VGNCPRAPTCGLVSTPASGGLAHAAHRQWIPPSMGVGRLGGRLGSCALSFPMLRTEQEMALQGWALAVSFRVLPTAPFCRAGKVLVRPGCDLQAASHTQDAQDHIAEGYGGRVGLGIPRGWWVNRPGRNRRGRAAGVCGDGDGPRVRQGWRRGRGTSAGATAVGVVLLFAPGGVGWTLGRCRIQYWGLAYLQPTYVVRYPPSTIPTPLRRLLAVAAGASGVGVVTVVRRGCRR
jgi:hypothetical protein